MGKNNRQIDVRLLFISFILIIAIIWLVVVLIGQIGELKKEHGKSLPIMEIFLGETTLEEIQTQSKSIKYPENRIIIDDNGLVFVFDNVTMSGRGNASWEMDKKSYNIKFKNKINLFNFDKVKKIALVSNGIDDTLLRNDLAYYIARTIDDSYKIDGEFVRLKIDEKDQGVYYLVKKIEISKQSIDLREPTGIIVELDNPYCEAEDKWERTERINDCLALKDIVDEGEAMEVAWESFIKNYNEFEEAVLTWDFTRMSELVDIKSLAEYYLVGEFASNPDMYVTSWYFYRDGLEDKIYLVLAWDFDAGFGNKNWGGRWREDFYEPDNTMARLEYSFEKNENDKEGPGSCKYNIKNSVVSPMLCYLIEMPEFKNEVVKIYEENLKGKRDEIMNYIDEKSKYLRKDAILNNELWGQGDYDEAVEYLKRWVSRRFDYFDENYTNKSFKMNSREL